MKTLLTNILGLCNGICTYVALKIDFTHVSQVANLVKDMAAISGSIFAALVLYIVNARAIHAWFRMPFKTKK